MGDFVKNSDIKELFGSSSLLKKNYETALSLIHSFRKTFVTWHEVTGKGIKSSYSKTKSGPTGKKMLGFFEYTVACLDIEGLVWK